MPERTFASVAGTALDAEPQHARLRGKGWRVARARRAEERHLRRADGGRDVHQAGIVRDDEIRTRDQFDRLVERRLADEVPADEPGSSLAIARRAEDHDRLADAGRKLDEVRPALRRPVLRA